MEIIQIVLKSIRTAVADSSAYVRKTATACIVKVFEVDRDQYVPLRDLTVKLFQDRNTSVVASSVATYHHLCIAKRPAVSCIDKNILVLINMSCRPDATWLSTLMCTFLYSCSLIHFYFISSH